VLNAILKMTTPESDNPMHLYVNFGVNMITKEIWSCVLSNDSEEMDDFTFSRFQRAQWMAQSYFHLLSDLFDEPAFVRFCVTTQSSRQKTQCYAYLAAFGSYFAEFANEQDSEFYKPLAARFSELGALQVDCHTRPSRGFHDSGTLRARIHAFTTTRNESDLTVRFFNLALRQVVSDSMDSSRALVYFLFLLEFMLDLTTRASHDFTVLFGLLLRCTSGYLEDNDGGGSLAFFQTLGKYFATDATSYFHDLAAVIESCS
jgi:hypothetical protein